MGKATIQKFINIIEPTFTEFDICLLGGHQDPATTEKQSLIHMISSGTIMKINH